MSLKSTPAAPVVLDMKTGIFNAVECIFEHIQAYQSKLQDILGAVCTAIMMMLSAHGSIVQLSILPGYIIKAADCFCEQHRVVTVQCFFVLTAATTVLSLFCCYCLKVQARQQRPLGRAQRQNRG